MLSGTFSPLSIKVLDTPHGPINSSADMANHFGSVWSSYSKDSNFHPNFVAEKNLTLIEKYVNNSPSPSAQKIESPITIFEFEVTINSMSGKTPGRDRISYSLLQNLPSVVKTRLVNLYNAILSQGILPHTWKNALVLPIPKSSQCGTSASDYRPISLLSCLSKTLEKIVASRIVWFALSNKLFDAHQVAFKEGQGTMDALLIFEHFVTSALSTKNHVSVLSIDFEKAYERIGPHAILRNLASWKIGKKIYNFVKNFLTCRLFSVKVNNKYSNTYKLFNGIPQGSPLSVILFIIAFDDINKIISTHKRINHIIYADDLLLFSKCKDLSVVQNDFIQILSELTNWSNTSGAKISFNKCRNFHICNKKMCPPMNLSFNNVNLLLYSTLKILGIIFDSKLTFKSHCKYLRLALVKRLDIIKYLSSKHCLVHPASLINATKALLLSKIDYGLPIYGHCAKNNVKLILPPYHTAARRSIRAFPTSPVICTLTEAGLPTIEERATANTIKLIPKLLRCKKAVLLEAVYSASRRKKHGYRPSTIMRCLNAANELGIPIKPEKFDYKRPVSRFQFNSLLYLDMHSFKKSTTPPAVYRQAFEQLASNLKEQGWKFLYTDGTKTVSTTAFAVVDSDHNTISAGHLLNFCSVFTAEANAVLLATQYALRTGEKYVVCTDSMSTIRSVTNIPKSNFIISTIRNVLAGANNLIKIMWVPSHVGIPGNETADERAKLAANQPLMALNVILKEDVFRLSEAKFFKAKLSEWNNFRHHYSALNSVRQSPTFPRGINCNDLRNFSRLRIGHTTATHNHLLKGLPPPQCPFCNSGSISVIHLLDNCQHFSTIRFNVFGYNTPSDALKSYDSESIKNINKYLTLAELRKLI